MILRKEYEAPDPPRSEIARYARCPETELPDFTETLIMESVACFSCKVCWEVFPVKRRDNTLDLGFTTTASESLAQNLRQCDRIVLFAATIGIGPDMLIRKYNLLSPAKAVICQAIGSAAVEEICDRFCHEVRETYGNTAPRFSPGYGDFPLSVQTAVFETLEPQREIGVTLGKNLLMSPSKSVTAIIGIRKGQVNERT